MNALLNRYRAWASSHPFLISWIAVVSTLNLIVTVLK